MRKLRRTVFFSRARAGRDCAHLAVPRAPPRAAGQTRTPSRPFALALSAVARRATVSDSRPLPFDEFVLLLCRADSTGWPRVSFFKDVAGEGASRRDFFDELSLTGSHTIFSLACLKTCLCFRTRDTTSTPGVGLVTTSSVSSEESVDRVRA